MKTRRFATFAPLACLVLALLVPKTVPSIAAQSQPVSFTAPSSAPAHVSAALRSSPMLFIQNAGQFDERAKFQVRGADRTLWLAEDGIWVSIVERLPVERLHVERSNVQRANRLEMMLS